MISPETKRQKRILTERYWDCLLGDFKSVLLLILQAPLIGWLCTVVWGSLGSVSPMLYFVLCLSSVWFGAVNACREIVKERAILQRESLFGLSSLAYLLSKFQVLSILALCQVSLLLMAVEWQLALPGPFVIQIITLWFCSIAGVGLGLTISSFAGNQERAVLSVPILIIPQILFSEIAVPSHLFGKTMAIAEKLMPVRWAYDSFLQLAAPTTSWFTVATNLVALTTFPIALGLLSLLSLKFTKST
ncbi:ABC transporter permease [Rubritalea tangerina]|uniref:ABC transporter permease n=2 Tax=Rubritalea tangerina TaxID=430798 RepID=A0ABW4ZBU5_9BACT